MRGAFIAAVALACAALGGWLAIAPKPEPPAQAEAQADADAEHAARIAQLRAIGYLRGGNAAPAEAGGSVVRRSERASPAPRLYVSGHAPQATLIGADGRVLARWEHDPRAIWPDVPPERDRAMATFRRAHLLPDGELLAIVEGVGVLKLGRDSELVWARRNGAHHAAFRLADGRILLLTRTAHVVPEVDPERPVFEDFVVELDAQGNELRRVSLLKALLRSGHALDPHPELPASNLAHVEAGDLLHTNSIQRIPRDHPHEPGLRAGHVLVSSLHLSAVFAVDLDAARVSWLRRGDFLVQHEARLLPEGNLLLFDNHTRERGSRALELAPSGETLWQHPPAGSPERFYSGCCSTAQRLPNGNTLIALTEPGRALEVTPDHEVVWEFRTPHRITDAKSGGKRVAALFALTAVPEPLARAWLAGPALAEAR